MMRLRRTESTPWIRPEEVFFDGVLPVVDDVVEIPKGKEHWELQLLLRGYVAVEETEDAVEPAVVEPKKSTRKKVANGTD